MVNVDLVRSLNSSQRQYGHHWVALCYQARNGVERKLDRANVAWGLERPSRAKYFLEQKVLNV